MKAQSPVGTILKNEVLEKNPKNSITIIGIDPGLQNLGIGIIQLATNKKIKTQEIPITKKRSKTYYTPSEIAKCIHGYSCMTIKLKQRELDERLYYIYEQICIIFEEHQPTLVIVEDSFVGINKNSALKLGLARGCILTALGKYKIAHETIAAKQIKMEVMNKGDAKKEDIYALFEKILPKWSKTSLDSSDALAGAMCGIKILQIRQNKESN